MAHPNGFTGVGSAWCMPIMSPERVAERGRLTARLDEGRWRDRAACRGLDVAVFVPVRGTEGVNGQEAKAVCRRCPVRFECLVDGLAVNDRDAIRGGAGGAWKRGLRRAFVGVGHDPMVRCGSLSCEWCRVVAEHWRRLDDPSGSSGPARVCTAAATHGRRSTQAKGCRCVACRWAASKCAQELASVGVDTAVRWVEWAGGIDVTGEAEAVAARLIASIEAEVELGRRPKGDSVHRMARALRAELRGDVASGEVGVAV